MDDFFKDLKFHVYDRLRSPIITAFTLSWITWNFSTILLLFGSGDFDKKIFMLSKIYESNWSYFFNGLVFPMGSAAIFILAYPFIARWAFIYWSSQLKTTKEKQVEIEDAIPMTLDDIRELKHNFYERSKTQEAEIERLQRINQQLKESDARTETIIDSYIESGINKDNELKDREGVISVLKDELVKSNNALADQIAKYESQIQSQETTHESIEESSDTRLERFLSEFNINPSNLNQNTLNHLLKLDIFKRENQLEADELRAIVYVLLYEGSVYRDSLKQFLDLSEVSFKVILNRLNKHNLCVATFDEDAFEVIEFTDDCRHKLYDSNISKISKEDLGEVVKLFGDHY